MKKTLMNIGGFFTNLARSSSDSSSPDSGASLASAASTRDVVLVLDASPSMKYRDWKPSRLAGAAKAAKAFVLRLAEVDPGARVAIVVYSGTAHIFLKLQSVMNTTEICRRIDRIKTGSATNITAGLDAARMVLRHSSCEQQVILLTDGQHNTGPTPESVAHLLKQSAVLECIGMAGTADSVDSRLADLASLDEFGRKRYRWIGEPEQLVRTFEQLATGLMRTR